MQKIICEVASACCLQGKNNLSDIVRDLRLVASACCLQGKNNPFPNLLEILMLHLPAVCKVKTTVASLPSLSSGCICLLFAR